MNAITRLKRRYLTSPSSIQLLAPVSVIDGRKLICVDESSISACVKGGTTIGLKRVSEIMSASANKIRLGRNVARARWMHNVHLCARVRIAVHQCRRIVVLGDAQKHLRTSIVTNYSDATCACDLMISFPLCYSAEQCTQVNNIAQFNHN